MKNQTQKTAPASPKARRKSETLTLTRECSWLLGEIMERYENEVLARYPEGEQRERERRERRMMQGQRRGFALHILALGLEATLRRESMLCAKAWWKLDPVLMSDEEMAAHSAIIYAEVSPREGEIDDAKEAAGVALIKAGKEAVSWNGV